MRLIGLILPFLVGMVLGKRHYEDQWEEICEKGSAISGISSRYIEASDDFGLMIFCKILDKEGDQQAAAKRVKKCGWKKGFKAKGSRASSFGVMTKTCGKGSVVTGIKSKKYGKGKRKIYIQCCKMDIHVEGDTCTLEGADFYVKESGKFPALAQPKVLPDQGCGMYVITGVQATSKSLTSGTKFLFKFCAINPGKKHDALAEKSKECSKRAEKEATVNEETGISEVLEIADTNSAIVRVLNIKQISNLEKVKSSDKQLLPKYIETEKNEPMEDVVNDAKFEDDPAAKDLSGVTKPPPPAVAPTTKAATTPKGQTTKKGQTTPAKPTTKAVTTPKGQTTKKGQTTPAKATTKTITTPKGQTTKKGQTTPAKATTKKPLNDQKPTTKAKTTPKGQTTKKGQTTPAKPTTKKGQTTPAKPTTKKGQTTPAKPTTKKGQTTPAKPTTKKGQTTPAKPTTKKGQTTPAKPTTKKGQTTPAKPTTKKGQTTPAKPTTKKGQTTQKPTTKKTRRMRNRKNKKRLQKIRARMLRKLRTLRRHRQRMLRRNRNRN